VICALLLGIGNNTDNFIKRGTITYTHIRNNACSQRVLVRPEAACHGFINNHLSLCGQHITVIKKTSLHKFRTDSLKII